MATVRGSTPHEERTAAEPRSNAIEPVVVTSVRDVNENIRLVRLRAVALAHTIRVS